MVQPNRNVRGCDAMETQSDNPSSIVSLASNEADEVGKTDSLDATLAGLLADGYLVLGCES
jgi:hypothetical protein